MALAAAPTTVWKGMLLMAAYGAGTLPVLLVWGAAASRIPPRVRAGFYRLSGFLLLVVAVAARASRTGRPRGRLLISRRVRS